MKIDLREAYSANEKNHFRNEVKKIEGYQSTCSFRPDLKLGSVISFFGGYSSHIRYTSEIIGFSKTEIYVLWDCYWSPIRDEAIRKIEILI